MVVAFAWSRDGYGRHAQFTLPAAVYPEMTGDAGAAIDSPAAAFRMFNPLVPAPAGMVDPAAFVARAAGIREQTIVEICDQEVAALDDPADGLVLRLVRTLLERQDLDDADYAAAEAVLGAPAIFELTTLVGYYSTLAMQLRVFRADDPPGH